MLLPKRVKYRRQQRGRLKGAAHRGTAVNYGDYGLAALEPAWITSNQIEASLTIQKKTRTLLQLSTILEKKNSPPKERIEGMVCY